MARTSVAREMYDPDKRCSSAGWYVISMCSGITRYSSCPTPASPPTRHTWSAPRASRVQIHRHMKLRRGAASLRIEARSGTVSEQDIVRGDTGAFDFLRKG